MKIFIYIRDVEEISTLYQSRQYLYRNLYRLECTFYILCECRILECIIALLRRKYKWKERLSVNRFRDLYHSFIFADELEIFPSINYTWIECRI